MNDTWSLSFLVTVTTGVGKHCQSAASVFMNKALLEHDLVNLFSHLWLFSTYTAELSSCEQGLCAWQSLYVPSVSALTEACQPPEP